MTFITIFILHLLYSAYAEPTPKYIEERPKHTFPVTTSSSHFSMELDYPRAFEVQIESFNSIKGKTGFCTTSPAKISTQTIWNGRIPSNSTNSSENGVVEGSTRSYDNIGRYKDYYFILDSVAFTVIATKDVTANSYVTITSDFINDVTDGRFEDAYLVIAEENDIMYIVTRKKVYYYNLLDFISAVENNETIPIITEQATEYRGYDSLINVKYYKSRLYFVADNVINAFLINPDGYLKYEIEFNKDYFSATKVFLTSVAFRGDYVYILDKFRGVYLIDISQVNKVNTDSVRSRYWFQLNAILEVANGQLLAIIGNSLHVISVASKTILREYIIVGDPIFKYYEFNRQVELYQSISDTYADNNFLFLLTGYFNMVYKHSIPGKFVRNNDRDSMNDYWSLYGTKAMVSIPSNSYSTITAVHNNSVSVLKIFEKNPIITCNMAGIQEGVHRYRILAFQKDCKAKMENKLVKFDTVCEIYQNIDLVVIQQDAEIGNTTQSKKMVLLLTVGIIVMFLVVIVFVYLFRKYKNQYLKLEDEIKFYRLEDENENADQIVGDAIVGNKKVKVGGGKGVSADKIEIEIELGQTK